MTHSKAKTMISHISSNTCSTSDFLFQFWPHFAITREKSRIPKLISQSKSHNINKTYKKLESGGTFTCDQDARHGDCILRGCYRAVISLSGGEAPSAAMRGGVAGQRTLQASIGPEWSDSYGKKMASSLFYFHSSIFLSNSCKLSRDIEKRFQARFTHALRF